MNVDDIRRHIAYKRDGERTLPAEVAQRMLDALDAGAEPDYQALLTQAKWPTPTGPVYHTAPVDRRALIGAEGIEAHDPDAGGRWGNGAVGQAAGVYVTVEPDERGLWADQAEWDIWEIDVDVAELRPDPINPGCWYVPFDVPAGIIRLHSTCRR